ncbi:MAG: DinB family protein [Thermoanaerobaculia bacterium]|nr:DinB family protein [Thermoanaerobaculia bacterium]
MNDLGEILSWSLSHVREHSLRMVRDFREEQWALQPRWGEHPPTWVIGHLLLADSYLLHLLKVEELPDDFPELLMAFGPSSRPSSLGREISDLGAGEGVSLPPGELVERLERTGALRCEFVAAMAAADLGRANPDHDLATSQPTIGHHLQALLVHEGHHAGQLAAWRQHHGLAPVPWVFAPRL